MSNTSLTPKNALVGIKHCLSTGLIPYICSKPGVGKSSLVRQAAEDIAKQQDKAFYIFNGNSMHPKHQIDSDFGFIDLRANMMTTMDLYGLPTFTDDKQAYMFARPDMIPEHGQGIIFVDELPQATQSTMGGFSEAFLDHRIGKHVIPEGWKFAAAGNRMKDRADAHKIPTHIKDRMNELQLEFSLEDWVEWATLKSLHPATITFAKFRPNLMDSFDPSLDINCTPRSVESSSLHIDAPTSVRWPLLAGCIGEGPANEMEAILRIFKDLPDPDYIKENPGKAPVPEKLDVLYAITTMLAMHSEKSNFDDLMKYISRITQVEFQVAFVKQALIKDSTVAYTDALLDFTNKHQELLVV